MTPEQDNEYKAKMRDFIMDAMKPVQNNPPDLFHSLVVSMAASVRELAEETEAMSAYLAMPTLAQITTGYGNKLSRVIRERLLFLEVLRALIDEVNEKVKPPADDAAKQRREEYEKANAEDCELIEAARARINDRKKTIRRGFTDD